MAKGRKSTKTESKKSRSDWEGVDGADELIEVPAKLLKHIKEAIAQSKPLARVGWEMSQTINLGRLDPGHEYESMRFACSIELPVPARPNKIADGIELCMEMVEAEINAKVSDLEEQLTD